MLNKLRVLIESIGLVYKKEMLKIVVINIFLAITGVLLFFFTKNIVFSISILGMILIVDYLLISSYQNKQKAIKKSHDDEFVNLIHYFKMFIDNGFNVYQSFRQLLALSTPWFKDALEKFILDMDNDKTITPFINFSNLFTLPSIRSLLLSIYQMVDEGSSINQFNQFTYAFMALKEKHINELKDRKNREYSNFSIFPMVGSGLIIMILSISIVSMMGELVNVL